MSVVVLQRIDVCFHCARLRKRNKMDPLVKAHFCTVGLDLQWFRVTAREQLVLAGSCICGVEVGYNGCEIVRQHEVTTSHLHDRW